MKTKIILLLALIVLLAVSGCGAGVSSRPDMVDIMPMPAVPTGQEKIVTLVPEPTATLPFIDPAASLTPDPAASPTRVATPTPALPPEAASPTADPGISLEQLGIDKAAYQDDFAGFAFDFPAGWLINAPTEEAKATSQVYTVTFLSKAVPAGPKQQEGIAEGQTKLDVTVIKDGAATLEDAVSQRREQLASPDSRTTVQSEEDVTLPGGLQAKRFYFDSMSGPAVELVASINGHMLLISGLGDLTLFDPITETLWELK